MIFAAKLPLVFYCAWNFIYLFWWYDIDHPVFLLKMVPYSVYMLLFWNIYSLDYFTCCKCVLSIYFMFSEYGCCFFICFYHGFQGIA
jgi:hypothetical protein